MDSNKGKSVASLPSLAFGSQLMKDNSDVIYHVGYGKIPTPPNGHTSCYGLYKGNTKSTLKQLVVE